MKCSWIEDKDNPSQCKADASVWSNFPVCEKHLEMYRGKLESMKRISAVQSSKIHGVSSFPERFRHLRMPGPGEIFRYGIEIAEFVEDPNDLGDLKP